MAYKFPEKIFPNAINTYLQCPFKFKCQGDSEVKAEFVDTPESFAGKAMHLALRDFFDISIVSIEERKNQDIGKLLRQSWARVQRSGWSKDYWNAKERLELFGSTEQEKAFGLQTIAVLSNYTAGADLSALPLSLEDWMECKAGEFRIAGRVDRIDQDSNSAISVWDYKTGKLPFHGTIEKIMQEDLQVPIYAIIASKLFPFVETIKSGLIYVKYSKVYTKVWTKEELQEVEKNIISAINTARKDKEFLPKINKLCPWCEYIKVCPSKDLVEGKNSKVDEVSW